MERRDYHYEVCSDGAALVRFGIRSNSGVCVRRVSSDFLEVDRLVRKCNRLQVSPIHLGDVVEDYCRG